MNEGLRRIHIIFVVLTSLWAAGFLGAAGIGLWEAHEASERGRAWAEAPIAKVVEAPPPPLWQQDPQWEETVRPTVEDMWSEVIVEGEGERPAPDYSDIFEAQGADGNKYRIFAPSGATTGQVRTYLMNKDAAAGVENQPEKAAFMAAFGVAPSALYWVTAWVIAGFLRDRRARQQDN